MKLIQRFWGLTVIGSCLLSSPIKATNQKLFDDNSCITKPSLTTQKSLDEQIIEFQRKISTLAENRPYTELTQLHTEFLDLKYDLSQWEGVGKSLNIYQWLHQNWHETVAGHIFFPHEIHTLIEYSYNDSFDVKSKIMWRLAIAAYHQHPLAQYYLVKTLSDLRKQYYDEELTASFIDLYQKAISSLFQSTNNNEACFALGKSHLEISYLGDFEPEKAHDFFAKGTDFKNQLRKIGCINIDMRKEACLKLAQQGYGLAYRKLARLYTDNDDEKVFYLNEAVKLGDYTSIIELGELYESNGNLNLAKEYFQRGVDQGVIDGYIQYATCLIGQVDPDLSDFSKDLKTLSPHIIEEAIKSLNLAAQASNPIGWECLSDLQLSLSNIEKTEMRVKASFDALVEGIKLGSPKSYDKMLTFLRKYKNYIIIQELYNTYGYPPQKGLDEQIEAYWTLIKK